jgi:hypothetical protein
MAVRGSREVAVSVGCLLLLGCWFWMTDGNGTAQAFWTVVLCVILGVGIGSAVSAIRHADPGKGSFAWVCLGLHLIVAGLAIAEAVRSRWLDG